MTQIIPLWLRWLLAGMLLLCGTVVAFLHLPGFGGSPHDRRWQGAPHLVDGTFHNPLPTTLLAKGHSTPAAAPTHVGRFSLARHRWDEPFERIVVASQHRAYQLLTPRIGEPVELDRTAYASTPWWRDATPN